MLVTATTSVTVHILHVPTETTARLQLWHQRLGHRNLRDVARLTDQQLPSKPCLCRTCIEGKSQRHRLAERNLPLHQAPRPGYLFHCDVHGPFRCSTNGGATYLHVVVDDYSRFIFLFLSKSSRFFELFSEHVKRVDMSVLLLNSSLTAPLTTRRVLNCKNFVARRG